ncbi:ATP-binding protein [Bacillus altitudinis]|uniref:ATP-binding protein n=1 Tax=Bacillus altitudinis TaxID=293387 RepID=UPI002FFE7336
MFQGKIWPEKNYKIEQTVIERLLKLDFQITDHLLDYIGKGAIISFRNGITARSSSLENEVLLINYSLEDGFHGITKNLSDIHQHLHYEETDFIKERMLSSLYKTEYEYKSTNSVIKNMKLTCTIKNPNIDLAYNQKNLSLYLDEVAVSKEFENNTQSEFTQEKDSLERTRIKIGKIENSNKDVFWEYGHTQLANRHLLISGKSGQGKTYFMQCLLLEKSKQEISSIVIDYTDGFLPHQLEDEFVENLGSKLVQQIVYNNKLPINPFSRNIRDIGGIKLPESDTDIAERVKSVFASVYKTLGIQQLNTLYNCILIGMQRFDNKMNLMHLKALLEEEGSSTALKTLSQLRPFIDRDPFTTSSTINWQTIIDKKGEVFILQLTGYPRDVQLIITEFILWDLWNFSVREGDKHIPMPVLLDEAQNLDHTEESPSARILTEGRKFGWSAWYATQFLKSQLDASELARMQNASQKIYFAPPEQELSTISSSIANEYYDRKYWENMLGNLKKGQCIVHGPHLKEDGSLSPTQAVIVNISPLKERM